MSFNWSNAINNALKIVGGIISNNSKNSSYNRMKELVDSNESNKVEKPVLPDTPEYELKSYDPQSDEELSAYAKDSLSDYQNKGVNAIESEINAKRSELEGQKENVAAAADEGYKSVNAAYNSAAEAVNNDSLKRGLARSSVAVNRNAEVETLRAGELADLGNKATAAVAEIDNSIGSLNTQLTKALNDFNIEYAAKLADKINDLKVERDKKTAEVAEYNNKIKQLQYDNEVNKIKDESDLYSDAVNRELDKSKLNLDAETLEKINKSNYNAMNDYLKTLSAEDAKKELTSSSYYREHTSDYYLYKLYQTYVHGK